MAAPLTRDELESTPGQGYAEVRPRLRTGDLFFASGNYSISRLIQRATDSAWSHSGIVFRLEDLDRVLLLEAVEDQGVRLAPMSKYVHDYEDGSPYDGFMVFARQRCVSEQAVSNVIRFGLDSLTRPYDLGSLAKIAARIVLGVGEAESDGEYICSELVQRCFANAGYEFAPMEGGFFSPADIWRDERVELLARVADA